MAFSVESAFAYLSRAHAHGRLGHAFLISGADRVVLEEFAVRLVGLVEGGEVGSLDEARAAGVLVVRPETKSRRVTVDQVRELERQLYLGGARGRRRVAVLVDADRMMVEPQNAFLKTLEEPPEGTLLLLLTQHPELLLETTLSRCIRVPLYGPSAAVEREAGSAELVGLLTAYFAEGEGDIGTALSFKVAFADLLKATREAIAADFEVQLKEESAHYKQTTEGDWLERRKKFYEGLAEAHYLQQRAALVAVLASWFGDALRQRTGRDALDLPEAREATAALGARLESDDLMARVGEVEVLRRHLETNVQEALALEVGFLRMLVGHGR